MTSVTIPSIAYIATQASPVVLLLPDHQVVAPEIQDFTDLSV
jgi:hypothetical protein